ncbi:MAG: aspartate carbamoyltransferase [Oscillospiraceae bacterium]|jgi:aspartate carbamoyltransferase catalytic subunit|nr:aspartate carbamoyltransferase [Oscillospiraceae bacterium]
MRHLIDFSDLTQREWQHLYHRFEDILEHPGDYRDALRGQTLASLFYEPSTRTRLSFEAAMQRLGGGVFGFSDPMASSVAKGETLKDTVIMVTGYSDAMVMRHPCEGAALAASLFSARPVINAGDGCHCHPTQTLTDLAAITRLFGGVDGLRIGLCGDLKYGRTIHSLLTALCRFGGVKVTLVSVPELALPAYAKRACDAAGIQVAEEPDLRSAIGDLDILYMTRVQRERFADPAEYERLKDRVILTPDILSGARKDMRIMHPLPRAGEIDMEVDRDPRAVYFEQARLGMVIRMALLLEMCRLPSFTPAYIRDDTESGRHTNSGRTPSQAVLRCPNLSCITHKEPYLPLPAGDGVCRYCDSSLT